MSDFDTGVPHSARVYNYWLGGTANYAADREAGQWRPQPSSSQRRPRACGAG